MYLTFYSYFNRFNNLIIAVIFIYCINQTKLKLLTDAVSQLVCLSVLLRLINFLRQAL